jgi:hypothetical protein
MTEQHQVWVLILGAALPENLPPGILSVAEDGTDKLRLLIMGRWCLPGRCTRGLQRLIGNIAENLQWVLPAK